MIAYYNVRIISYTTYMLMLSEAGSCTRGSLQRIKQMLFYSGSACFAFSIQIILNSSVKKLGPFRKRQNLQKWAIGFLTVKDIEGYLSIWLSNGSIAEGEDTNKYFHLGYEIIKVYQSLITCTRFHEKANSECHYVQCKASLS